MGPNISIPSPVKTGGFRISPHQICSSIRDQVISGVLTPGQRLTEEALAIEFGTSRIPIREALRQLEAEGFLRAQPNYGTFVEEISEVEAADLLEIREVLEPLAAARAATRATPEMLDVMETIVAAGRKAADSGSLNELPDLNAHLHSLIVEASGSIPLSRLIEQLRHKIAWVYAVALPRRAADSWVEHQLIVDALGRGDADSARALVIAHIRAASAAYRLRKLS